MAVPVEQWIAVRRLLNQSRGPLSLLAARRYPASRLVVGAPFLALSVPSEPVPVDELWLSWGPSPAFSLPVPDFLPAGFSAYSAAIEGLDPPAVFENRAGHRLLDVSDKHLTFGPGSYFDELDTTEALAHEFCGGGTAFRDGLGDPFDLQRRSVIPTVQTLLISRDGRFLVPAGGLPPSGDLDQLIARAYPAEIRDAPLFYLGVGLDPLTLAASMLTVAVVDSLPDTGGRPFTAEAVERFVREEPVTPAGAAALALAVRNPRCPTP